MAVTDRTRVQAFSDGGIGKLAPGLDAGSEIGHFLFPIVGRAACHFEQASKLIVGCAERAVLAD
jgi:hypothetical protein